MKRGARLSFSVYLFFLFTGCTSGQNEKTVSGLTDEQIVKRYLENGAWKLRYFSSDYQIYLDSAIAANPKFAYLYQQKSMPYFKQGKYEVGLRILDKAVELDPKSHIDYRAFIKCIFAKTYENAIKDFEVSKKVKGENGFVMDHSYNFYIGLCHLQLGEYKKAVNFLEQSIDYTRMRNGEDWIHFLDVFYAGIACQEMGMDAKAISYFDKSLKLYPNFSDAEYYKAISLFRTSQAEKAEELLNHSEVDFKKGYTINEANAVYEFYPYQLKQFYIDMLRLTKR
jgi:tetratricopeptide (TPR) repeat protein